MIIARIAIVWTILMFLTFGLWLLLAPDKLGAWLDVEAASPKGRTEIRAFYGGIQLGMVVFLGLVLALRPDWIVVACAVIACTNLAVVGCRLVGITLDGSGATGMWVVLAIEATTGLLGLAGFIAASQAADAGGP